MIKVKVQHKLAWEGNESTPAPMVWAFIGNTKPYESIFKEITGLTETADSREHAGKFYFNNINKWWYVRDKSAANLAIKKINILEKFEAAKLYWNI